MIQIAGFQLDSRVVLAPMAGVTDRPFRQLCRRFGAGSAASEMVSSDPSLRSSRKTQLRLDHLGEQEPRIVQIAGADPMMMADAARFNVDQGAQIIDINMGCPAKKVCKKAAGSALLKDERLVQSILEAVVAAVDVPVTLKIRTGWDTENRNATTIAHIAEDCGIEALAVHGRTRACKYQGSAEYETIAAVKNTVSIPVLANGDITSPKKAQEVLDQTAADGIMIGRGAQGNPWLFREIQHYMDEGMLLPRPSLSEIRDVMIEHILSLHQFYGEYMGIRIARKHVGWYVHNLKNGAIFRRHFNLLNTASKQLASAQEFFEQLIEGEVMAA